MFTVDQASRFYRVPVIDYERSSKGLLVSSGSGLMMSVMDAAPNLRWCVDFDALPKDADLESFLTIASRATSIIGVCGWFTITRPETIRQLVQRDGVVVYGGNVRFGAQREAETLEGFLELLREPLRS